MWICITNRLKILSDSYFAIMREIDKFDIVYFMTHEKSGVACYREEQNEICLFEFNGMYGKQIEPNYPDMVCAQMMYYTSTLGLKKTGKYLKHGGIGIGVWEYYNEDGTLDHTEDMDEHFPVKWEQMDDGDAAKRLLG